MTRLWTFLIVAGLANAVVVLDRIAVVVNNQAVKTSDIAFDLRVTAFLNRQKLDVSPQLKRQSAERLIDQQIIRQDIVSGDYRRPADREAQALLDQLRRDRFAGSDSKLRDQLQGYGLNEDELRRQLLWQLTVLRFIDERFRPAVVVTDDEIQEYYQRHLSELRRDYPAGSSLEKLAPNIRSALEAQRINESFNQWLDAARKRARIEYKQEALQ